MQRLLLTISFFLSLTLWGQVEKGGTPFGWNNGGVLQGAIWYELSMPDASELIAEDVLDYTTKTLPYRFSTAVPVSWNTEVHGRWTTLSNGDRIWRMGIRVPSATMLSCVFDAFELPPGARLYFYNRAQTEFVGPYMRNSSLGEQHVCSLPVSGGEMIMEYFEPFSQRGNGYLSISGINAGYRHFHQPPSVIDSDCFRLLNADEMRSLQEPSRSVVLMLVDNARRTATGTLINSRQGSDNVYLITATSALIGDPETFIFVLDYTPNGCNNEVSCWSRALYGSEILASDTLSGLSLLRLRQRPKNAWSAYFSGWSNGLSPSTTYFSIQHGLGCSQSISITSDPPFAGELNGLSTRMVDTWNEGGAFAGSIGSPLFNESGQLEAVFVGGDQGCGMSGLDAFGSFRNAWSSFSPFLQPGGVGFSAQNGTYSVFDEKSEETLKAGIYIYPNPASDHVMLRSPNASGLLYVQIIDALGKVCLENSEPTPTLSLEQLLPGVYQVRLVTTDGKHWHQSLIVR